MIKMIKRVLIAFVCIGLFMLAGLANATVLTFDDLPPIPYDGTSEPVAPIVTYGGANWSGGGMSAGYFGYLKPEDINDYYGALESGFLYGRMSEPHVAYNDSGAEVSVSNGTFDFNGAYLTAAWNDGLEITVEGYSGGSMLYSRTVTVNPYAAQWFDFDFLGIDTLVFYSSGGTNVLFPGSSSSTNHFVMDDFTFNEPELCECDLNRDSKCDMQDWLIFGQDWGRTDCNDPGVEECECDITQDGKCDMQDWLKFGEDWGRTDCP